MGRRRRRQRRRALGAGATPAPGPGRPLAALLRGRPRRGRVPGGHRPVELRPQPGAAPVQSLGQARRHTRRNRTHMAAPLLIRHALLGLLLAASAGCGHLFYLPEPGLRGTPAQIGVPYEDVHLRSSDGTRLHGWLLPARSPTRRGLIYFLHGNAENISTHYVAMSWLNHHGWDLFFIDYRGFGLSEGSPHIRGVHRDARAGLDWAVARARQENLPLVVYGQSLGGATAATLVAHSRPGEVQALVLDSAFSGYRRIAR